MASSPFSACAEQWKTAAKAMSSGPEAGEAIRKTD